MGHYFWRRVIYSLCWTILIILSFQALKAQHYFGNNQQIPLTIDSTKLLIKFDPDIQGNNQGDVLNAINRIVATLPSEHIIDNFVLCTLETSNNYFEFIDSLNQIEEIYISEPYYLDEYDQPMLVGTRFYVGFDKSLTRIEIDLINELFNLETGSEMPNMPNVFVMHNTDTSGFGILELANLYHELPQTRYAHPQFGVWVKPFSYNLYDCYHDYQDHIKKVIGGFNSASVWDFAGLTDDTIYIAVLDDGLSAHEDLPAERITDGWDFAENDNVPIPGPYQAHGMGCAGIIGASHTTDSLSGTADSTGIISLNPVTKIIPIKIFYDDGTADGISDSTIAEAIKYAYLTESADILSNSWGYRPGIYFGLIADAIEDATNEGRNGLGSLFICAAGNYGPKYYDVAFPASQPNSYAVGAIQMNDVVWGYSCTGPGLDIVAPSGATCLQGDVWTLDQMNWSGFNPQVFSYALCDNIPVSWNCPPDNNDKDYDCNFGGTSATAPIVAGVASLIMAKDSTLTYEEIYTILDSSAVKDLDWGSLPDTPSTVYGHGRVDAFRAILSISRGDINNDGAICEIDDLVYYIEWVYNYGPAPFPHQLLADVDCSGEVDISDQVYLTNFMFNGGPAPPYPCFEF